MDLLLYVVAVQSASMPTGLRTSNVAVLHPSLSSLVLPRQQASSSSPPLPSLSRQTRRQLISSFASYPYTHNNQEEAVT